MKSIDSMRKKRVLVVDDDRGARQSLREILQDHYDVVCVTDGLSALRKMRQQFFELVLLDIALPNIDGLETLRRIRALNETAEVIMVSATDRAREAACAMKLGAFDYLTKPFGSAALLKTAAAAINKEAGGQPAFPSDSVSKPLPGFGDILGGSDCMRAIFSVVPKIASASSNVLISGESGTGKELVARAIHAYSQRATKPFLAINCAAIPRELMESELFGHEKGAFTGAHRRSPGKFAHADRGTVFLDEISSLDIGLQAKLLRFLQDQEVIPVGGIKATRIDIRVIAAANTRLEDMVRSGRFREDLFFRLNVLPIELPPLRRRTGDIRLLANHFLERAAAKQNKRIKGFSSSAMSIIEAYRWPGNIRELENMIERLVVLSTEGRRIRERDLPFELLVQSHAREHSNSPAITDRGLLHARRLFERHYIIGALKRCSWNQSETARGLKIHRNTLIQKMRRLEITVPQV